MEEKQGVETCGQPEDQQLQYNQQKMPSIRLYQAYSNLGQTKASTKHLPLWPRSFAWGA